MTVFFRLLCDMIDGSNRSIFRNGGVIEVVFVQNRIGQNSLFNTGAIPQTTAR